MPRKTQKSAAKKKSAEPEAAPTKKAKNAESAVVKKTTAAKSTTKSIAKSAGAKKTTAKTSSRPAKSASAAEKTSPATKSTAKPRKAAKKSATAEPDAALLTGPMEDPIGDTTDGEAHHLLASEAEAETATAMMEAYREDTSDAAEHGLPEAAPEVDEPDETSVEHEPRSEAHLERLQKILSQAGVASRRHAEEMIAAGRVMVNGQVVTHLGSKADPARDHIRVDNKLIQGAERHRTFLLNKPRGYVTTVSDPEGRPTVMQFFGQMRERLYPVGRLDFQSEGLLLMTNDGELANSLTRAASGVEKTYVVKVAGQLSAEQLDRLREGGVSIEKGEQGSQRVRTAPAEVRQIRPGDNPWYEVVLIEGRNREIRKMFSAAGHFVEKIRRVGYGPLALDVEPGRFRELSAEEVNALRLTAEGKLKPRRPKAWAMLPKDAGRPAEERGEGRGRGRESRRESRPAFGRGSRPQFGRESRPESTREPRREFPPRKQTERGRREDRPFPQHEPRDRQPREREPRGGGERGQFAQRRFGDNRAGRPFQKRDGRSFDRPGFNREGGERRERPERSEQPRQFDRPERRGEGSRERFSRPREDRFGQRGSNTPPRPGAGQRFGRKPEQRGESGGRPRFEGRPGGFKKPNFDRPNFARPERGERRESGRGEFPGQGRRQERPPHRESGPREEGAERGERPRRFDRPQFNRERDGRPDRFQRGESRFGQRPGGGFRGGNRSGRPPRRDRGES